MTALCRVPRCSRKCGRRPRGNLPRYRTVAPSRNQQVLLFLSREILRDARRSLHGQVFGQCVSAVRRTAVAATLRNATLPSLHPIGGENRDLIVPSRRRSRKGFGRG